MRCRRYRLMRLGDSAAAAGAAIVLSVAVAAFSISATPTRAGALSDAHPVSILGPTRMNAEGLVASYEAVGREPRITVTLAELAQIYIEEGERYGVRADIAWAQSIIETGWFTYPDHGQVRPADNNFAGIGAYDGGARGFGYADARSGVRAQMQLLAQYANEHAHESFPDERLVSTPKRGAAPTWLEMGNGNWATSSRYTEAILKVYFEMIQLAGLSLVDTPAAVARPGDGLWLAGTDGHVYDVGDARFWGSAGGRITESNVVGIGVTRSAEGYWLVTADGHVGAYGDAVRWGDAPGASAGAITDIAGDPSGSGYWILSSSGEIFAFGSALSMEPAPGILRFGSRFVAMAATPSGEGLWLADDDGRVVALGDATHFGDMTGRVDDFDATDPFVDLAPRPWSDGYWLVTNSGVVHAFGEAQDFGTLRDDEGEDAPLRAVAGIRSSVTGEGYWLVATDGHVAGLGDAADFPYLVRAGGPISAIAGRMDA